MLSAFLMSLQHVVAVDEDGFQGELDAMAGGDDADALEALFEGEEDGDSDGEEEFSGPETFEEVDADKDGKVSLEELLSTWHNPKADEVMQGHTGDLVKARFTEADADKDGSLTKEEFDKCVEHLHEHSMYLDLLIDMDKNKDGGVSLDEVIATFGDSEATDEETEKEREAAREHFPEADIDKDGKLDAAELTKMMSFFEAQDVGMEEGEEL